MSKPLHVKGRGWLKVKRQPSQGSVLARWMPVPPLRLCLHAKFTQGPSLWSVPCQQMDAEEVKGLSCLSKICPWQMPRPGEA